ncbi:hypothetical protein ACI78T_02820 [Blastococcus sp. SYSU D00922]
MTTAGARSRASGGPPDEGEDRDDYSPALAAWALLVTLVVLAGLVAAVWGLRGL